MTFELVLCCEHIDAIKFKPFISTFAVSSANHAKYSTYLMSANNNNNNKCEMCCRCCDWRLLILNQNSITICRNSTVFHSWSIHGAWCRQCRVHDVTSLILNSISMNECLRRAQSPAIMFPPFEFFHDSPHASTNI